MSNPSYDPCKCHDTHCSRTTCGSMVPVCLSGHSAHVYTCCRRRCCEKVKEGCGAALKAKFFRILAPLGQLQPPRRRSNKLESNFGKQYHVCFFDFFRPVCCFSFFVICHFT